MRRRTQIMYVRANPNMAEVTRLTRAGQLEEAMAVLRGTTMSPATSASATQELRTTVPDVSQGASLLDMLPPSALTGGSWTAAPQGAAADPSRLRTHSRFAEKLAE